MESSLNNIYGALAHPTRRTILEYLQSGSQIVSQLSRQFDISPPAISKHLRILEQAGLIHRRRTGRTQHISLNGDGLLPAARYIDNYQAYWEDRLVALDAHLHGEE